MFSDICIAIFSKLFLQHAVLSNFSQSVFSRSDSNNDVVTCVLEEASLRIVLLNFSMCDENTLKPVSWDVKNHYSVEYITGSFLRHG
jgi:hypothetical protein